ncbi:alpha/beta hydrolase [Kriegella aquimaris]|uniref:Pimeloyl-ACP methyl ester carboxylesterase n=1 Tax=Kriegella aquimaris TaxID=192904 RepID=A0A1G9YYJ3_9FLAO|nr:alpha/beta hydrolase [Kriegella aquimaris]SDN13533.1 Pimeloyl-ACP methyl ester carboxylesterase [Kriegella aquimaris]
MQIKKIKTKEFEFDCRVLGNEENELIIFLHGFPETSFMWMNLMEKLSSIGYYCVAPDMRGYSENACPKGVKKYTIKKLSDDILNIVNAVNVNKFHLIAHDWGAGIGWNIVYHNPEKIISWTALSVPHSRGFRKAVKMDNEQRKKSRYIGWFLFPIIPEIMLRKNDFEKFRKLWKHSSPEELNNYLTVFRRKYTLTAALNYYRANFKKGKNQPVGDIVTPTLFIWGKNDLAIGKVAAENNHKYMKGDYTFLKLDGGHWLIQSNYLEVEKAIIDHLTKYKTAPNNVSYEKP